MTDLDRIRAACSDCGFSGTLRALSVHSCYVQEQGGRCEDYPCCGHTDGDGCQTRPEHTSAYYLDGPGRLHALCDHEDGICDVDDEWDDDDEPSDEDDEPWTSEDVY